MLPEHASEHAPEHAAHHPSAAHGTAEKLVHMANQIGKAFALRPAPEAVGEIANHIHKFWEKRMLTQIFAHLEAGGHGLDNLPKQGLIKLRQSAK